MAVSRNIGRARWRRGRKGGGQSSDVSRSRLAAHELTTHTGSSGGNHGHAPTTHCPWSPKLAPSLAVVVTAINDSSRIQQGAPSRG